VTADPPFVSGADQARTTPLVLCGVAVRLCGAPGTVAGVALSAFEAGPVPIALVAVTVNE